MTNDTYNDRRKAWERKRFWRTAFDFAIVAAAFALLMLIGLRSQGQTFAPGTVFASRNINPADNTSPGYRLRSWLRINHLAIVGPADSVIESQADQGVIETPLAEYLARPYRPLWAFPPLTPQLGEAAASWAETLVGTGYRFQSSLRISPPVSLGLNCNSVIGISYGRAVGRRGALLMFPDGIWRHIGRFVGPPWRVR